MLPVEIRARLTNVVSMVLVSGRAVATLGAWTGAVASIIAALVRMELLGASGRSAAIEIVVSATTAMAGSIDLIKVADLRAAGEAALHGRLVLVAEAADPLR